MPREKSSRVRRSFTPEFKRDALRLVAQGQTITDDLFSFLAIHKLTSIVSTWAPTEETLALKTELGQDGTNCRIVPLRSDTGGPSTCVFKSESSGKSNVLAARKRA